MKKIAKKMHEEPTDPGPKTPDARDARIAELEATIYNLTLANKDLSRDVGAVASPPKALVEAIEAHRTMSRRTGLRPHDHLLYRVAGLA